MSKRAGGINRGFDRYAGDRVATVVSFALLDAFKLEVVLRRLRRNRRVVS